MKKRNFKSYIFYLLLIGLSSFTAAQSDYATVQKFKKECVEIEQQIKEANSAVEMNLILENIEQLRTNYSRHSELLDKALYPEKYDEMIGDLNILLALREVDFKAVENLKAEVSDLNNRVDTLSIINNELQSSLEEIQLLFDKTSRETASLNSIISELKIALHKRDVLVMNMVDSLMPPVMREKPMLSSEDEEQIMSDVEKDNILVNVKKTIRDNMKYLDLTSLQPEDLTEIQEQQLEFADTWARIGPRLAEVYSEDKNRAKELYEIDSLFALWTTATEVEAWQSIKEEFAAKGVMLDNFSDGKAFVNSINQYIESEKKTIEVVPEEEAKHSFEQFADQTWKAEIEPKWTPFLIENGMLAENSKDAIEENIDIWRSEIYPSKWWLWVIISGFLFSGLVVLIRLLKNGSQYYEQVVE